MRHNATFFAVNSKLKYYNWSTKVLYETGISLTADITSMEEFKGDLFAINTLDGLQYVNISRLTAAAISGASSVYIETDAAARLSGMSLTTGTIRVGSDNYAYTAVNVTTGQITLSGTLSSNYAINTITTRHQAYASVPKGSKLAFWANSLNIIGVEIDTTDMPSYTLYFSEFVVASNYGAIVSFPATNYETVNSKLLDLVATKDYLYLFSDSETYSIARTSVNVSTGARIPQEFSRQYGVVNSRSVAVMGNSIAWITHNKRIMFGEVRIENGALNIDISETFDSPIKELLNDADDDQSNAVAYYLTKSKELHIKMSLQGQTVEFVYDNNIKQWCPPDTNKYFVGIFERSGEPYALAEDDDTVYALNTGLTDDGGDIECIIAFGEFSNDDSRGTFDVKALEVSGNITYGTSILYKPRMNYADGVEKEIEFTSRAIIETDALASTACGLFVLGGSGTIQIEKEFDEKLSNFPAIVEAFQPIFMATGENSAFAIKSWSQPIKEFNSFNVTTL